MQYKYIFFDLDGTLTDPGIGITNSVMYALDKFGIHAEPVLFHRSAACGFVYGILRFPRRQSP